MYMCVCVYLSVCLSIYLSHISFIYSSVAGRLGCFHVLAIVNSAAMNTRVHVSFQIRVFVFSGYIPGVGLLDHMTILFLVF